ncbi:hypothetical protein XMD420_000119 [Marinobacterium sp. xm-d-420]|uniref:hypothetical protein n=1 Tax=Marinobacterium sp. xm-d-420 TaxID=2497737 RepID=UPI001569FD12|nr:hypothetical protein [Marinobacterium sp. xm-d-420]NRP26536.1 hypothetical protein [Marinobacterium sp. xm-d-420]
MIVLLNDHEVYNVRYRSSLISALVSNNYKYTSIGILDGFFSILRALYYIFITDHCFFSSNMKSNLFFLIFFTKSGVVLFNGLGRYRKSKFFRLCLVFFIKINFNKTFIFQNYADYRYFKTKADGNLSWIPGSGGTCRNIGDDKFLIVTRIDKIDSISDSIYNFISSFCLSEVYVVGCSEEALAEKGFDGCLFKACGYLPQDDLFIHGSNFIQPQGYGEGIPHTLVDAICSGMDIWMKPSEFINFGFYKLGFRRSHNNDSGWSKLIYDENSKVNVSSEVVVNMYLNCLLNSCARNSS